MRGCQCLFLVFGAQRDLRLGTLAVSVTPYPRLRLSLYLSVAILLIALARFVAGDVNNVVTIANDCLAGLGGVLAVRWPRLGAVVYGCSYALVLAGIATTTPAEVCVILILLSLTEADMRVGSLAALTYAGLAIARAEHPVEVLFSGVLTVAPWGIGAIAHVSAAKARQLAELERESESRFRQMVARQVHDSLARSHVLIGLHLQTAQAASESSAEVQGELSKAEQYLDRANEDLHGLLRILRREAGAAKVLPQEPQTMKTALEPHRLQLVAAGFQPEFSINAAALEGQALGVFATVLGEAVTNVLRHGKPGPCSFRLHEAEDTLILTARNRVRGEETRSGEGLGLRGLGEYMHTLRGGAAWEQQEDIWQLTLAWPKSPSASQESLDSSEAESCEDLDSPLNEDTVVKDM